MTPRLPLLLIWTWCVQLHAKNIVTQDISLCQLCQRLVSSHLLNSYQIKTAGLAWLMRTSQLCSTEWYFITQPWQHVLESMIPHAVLPPGQHWAPLKTVCNYSLPYAWYYHPLALRACCNVIGMQPWSSHFKMCTQLEPLTVVNIQHHNCPCPSIRIYIYKAILNAKDILFCPMIQFVLIKKKSYYDDILH